MDGRPHKCGEAKKGPHSISPERIAARKEMADRIVAKAKEKGWHMATLFEKCHFAPSNLFNFKKGLSHESRYEKMEDCIDKLPSRRRE